MVHLDSPEVNYPPGSKSEALQLGVHLILLYFIRISLLLRRLFLFLWWVVDGITLFGCSKLLLTYYPPGSKSEALQLGVHLILLYFIRI